jgi:hypothetical protein
MKLFYDIATKLSDQFRWKCLAKPPFSLDLVTSDLHFFGPLKRHFEGKHICCDDKVKAKVHWWLLLLHPNFFSVGNEYAVFLAQMPQLL